MTLGAQTDRSTTTFQALVLAGSRGPSDPVAQAAGVSHKCFASISGVPMIVRVVDALAASPWIGDIAIAIEDPGLVTTVPALDALGGRLSAFKAAETPSLSVRKALEGRDLGFPLLVTTADHALLTPEILDLFLRGALESDADIVAGLAPARVIQAAYPETRRTYLRFRGEGFSGANLFALLSPQALHAIDFWRRIERQRKRPWQLAKAFGLGSLLAYALRRHSLNEAMARISPRLGCRAEAVVLPVAEAAIDVDKPADLELVEKILSNRPRVEEIRPISAGGHYAGG